MAARCHICRRCLQSMCLLIVAAIFMESASLSPSCHLLPHCSFVLLYHSFQYLMIKEQRQCKIWTKDCLELKRHLDFILTVHMICFHKTWLFVELFCTLHKKVVYSKITYNKDIFYNNSLLHIPEFNPLKLPDFPYHRI